MNAIKNTILAILIIGVLTVALFFIQGRRNPLCEPALIVGYPDNRARDIITRIIEEEGGLPQEDADLDVSDHRRVMIPVKDWRIRSAVLKNQQENFTQALRDDKPVMSYTIDLDVDWEDGAQGIVQWTSWRYGLVSCPLVFSKGSGPTGQIRIIALTPTPPPLPQETPTPPP